MGTGISAAECLKLCGVETQLTWAEKGSFICCGEGKAWFTVLVSGKVDYADEADIENGERYHQRVAGFVEAALEIRKAIKPDDTTHAVSVDKALTGSNDRADYITSVSENGGLSVATLRSEVQAFCCLDHGYFFGKPFISLLIVSPDARRLGLGMGLLSHNASAYPEVWTSTN